MENFHLWDLEGAHVKVNPVFLSKLNLLLSNKFITKKVAYQTLFSSDFPFNVFKNMLKPSYSMSFFLPLPFLLRLCDSLQISKDELEVNVLAYKSWGSVNYIEDPKLPININPVFDMLYAHHIGDGTVSIAKNRMPYFAYRQFNEFYRNAYVRKIEGVFGKINYKKLNFRDITRVRCPSSLSALFFKYYRLDDRAFLSDTARISNKIFEKGRESILAVLVAFIIDEGNVDSTQIAIKLKNKLLVSDLGRICTLLNYRHAITLGKGDYEGYSTLHILREGMKKFYEEYLIIHEKYNLIDLGFKGEKIRRSFEIRIRPIQRTKGNSDLIKALLEKECLSVNQIAEKIKMTRQGVRYHIHNLLKASEIKIVDRSQLNWIYGI